MFTHYIHSSIKLITWNIRGLNKTSRQKEIKKCIRSNKVSMIALLEHKVKEQKAS